MTSNDILSTGEPGKTRRRRSRKPAVLTPSHFIALTILALAPLPLASNRMMPIAILAITIGGLAIVLAWRDMRFGAADWIAGRSRHLRWVTVLFSMVCLWGLVQASPMPIAGLANPLWSYAAQGLDTDFTGHISLTPTESYLGVMRLVMYALFFWITARIFSGYVEARLGMQFFVAVVTAYSLYGLISYTAGNTSILWYQKWAYQDSLSSTFVNKNHYATFAGMGALTAIGMLVGGFRDVFASRRSGRERMEALLASINPAAALFVTAFMINLSALVMTGSRAGLMAFGVGLLSLSALFIARAPRSAFFILPALALAGFVVIFSVLNGSGEVLERLDTLGDDVDKRNGLYAMTWYGITTVPILGTGLGSFEDYFRMVYGPPVFPWLIWDHAHNTYLENMLELGIPAAMALFAAVGILLLKTISGALTRRRHFVIPLIVAALAVQVCFHALFDFSLEMPAVVLSFVFLLALGFTQALGRSRSSSSGAT